MTRSPTEIIAQSMAGSASWFSDEDAAQVILADLVDAGWLLFRPDECATTKASGRRGGGHRSEFRFYLVPVEGENP